MSIWTIITIAVVIVVVMQDYLNQKFSSDDSPDNKANPSNTANGPTKSTGSRSIGAGLSALSDAAERFSSGMAKLDDIQKALSPLRQAVWAEQYCLEKIAEHVEKDIEHRKKLDAMDKKDRALYEKNYKRVEAILFDGKPATKHNMSIIPPNFQVGSTGNVSVDSEVNEKISDVKIRRDDFIESFRARVSKLSSELFTAKMKEMVDDVSYSYVVNLLDLRQKTPEQPTRLADGDVLNPQSVRLPSKSTAVFESAASAGTSVFDPIVNRKTPFLVHFTDIRNLRSILNHGILSVLEIERQMTPYERNDVLRLDGRLDAISLSVGHPNDKMFYKYRMAHPHRKWVVVVVNSSILSSHSVAFNEHNAADKRMSARDMELRKTHSAFLGMFREIEGVPSREEQALLPSDPTDVQAEVLVLQKIEPRLITGLVFSDQDCARGCATYVPDHIKISVHEDNSGFFAARSYVRKSGWRY